MQTKDFFYELPERLIAQTPAIPRDASRLLVYDRKSEKIADRHFYDLPSYLKPGDVLVINTTKVLPARIFGYRNPTVGGDPLGVPYHINGVRSSGAPNTSLRFVAFASASPCSAEGSPPTGIIVNQSAHQPPTTNHQSPIPQGAKVEFLLHKRKSYTEWETLACPAKRVKIGDIFTFSDELSAEITGCGDEGIRILNFKFDGVFENILQNIGEMPLPHYIRTKPADPSRYQTVYARETGSSAAPTAGLHFAPELLEKLKSMGVEIAEILLHVGLGTFRPVKTENIESHKMHSEFFSIDEKAACTVNAAKREGRRVIAVGTTSVRVLESAADECGFIQPFSGETDIFIYPPYKFRAVDAMITNFHLPESTLLMLVAAFLGREQALSLYRYAVEQEYRFFSFGDACLFV
ncbi:MAG: tRNA preQ1(34) S-adenosylmethionine ribosyltransferase-isomerase QueA [Firmicutes bacterium]|nr:tRNA preQ1(34) S-adenosylmethionine ribosyltransferase-isomerase QueA [Bacillota bacterium]